MLKENWPITVTK